MVAALSAWHEQHEAAARALRDVDVLPAHVLLEAYSVLTRLPGGLAAPGPVAGDVLARRFGGVALALAGRDRRALLTTLADAGIVGGASYDGLVALEAERNGHALLTLDRRAQETYRRLGVRFELIRA